jgi:hypothetical protein
MVDDIIAPFDAFELLLCAHYGRSRLRFVKKIRSYDWFRRKSPWRARDSVRITAVEVSRKFTEHVRKGDVRLRGSLARLQTGRELQDAPGAIPLEDCREGTLDIFDQILKIDKNKYTFVTAYTYLRVYCVKADVLKLLNSNIETMPVPPPPPQKRRAGVPEKFDWAALKEMFFALWQEHGDFRQPKNQTPGWNSQAAAAKTLLDNIKRPDERPDQKVVERHIKVWIEGIPSRGT